MVNLRLYMFYLNLKKPSEVKLTIIPVVQGSWGVGRTEGRGRTRAQGPAEHCWGWRDVRRFGNEQDAGA